MADVLKNMGDNQVRRLPVVDRDKRLVGVVSLGDLSRAAHEKASGSALKEISEKPVTAPRARTRRRARTPAFPDLSASSGNRPVIHSGAARFSPCARSSAG